MGRERKWRRLRPWPILRDALASRGLLRMRMGKWNYRIVAGSQSAICGKIISRMVVITIDIIRMLVPL